MMSRLPLHRLFLLLAALTVGLGWPLPARAADESADGEKEEQAEEEIPLAERNHIEVEGVWYPVFQYPKEAKPTYDPTPRLPRKAQKEARGGLVLLGVLIDTDGTVIDTQVAMSNTEADIEDAAKKTLRRWVFPIKADNGHPIPYAVMVPVRFDATPHFGPQ
ncbi:energy transducer TonB [Actomonas aquatica]|uniref:Energy transducer TonB n=1 Tax=Actomonas aquatica TaxID=2866162 RepID=A0ABZ1C3M9_9BACT|nr:energy transducer TonB [Opitutus sp. WL0086]WRQ85957.1 energy transducer TonB [Opitutus sp. WL0086]